MFIKTDSGNFISVDEWFTYYINLLKEEGLNDEQILFRVELKKAELELEDN